MIHELKDIIRSAKIAQSKGIKTVLASVVSLDGSSYRRPGVRMSIQENGKMPPTRPKENPKMGHHIYQQRNTQMKRYTQKSTTK